MSAERRGPTLALDASTYTGTVAVLDGARVLAEAEVAMRGRDEERLMPAVAAALAEAAVAPGDLGRVVCGDGPGSFTSLRIAGGIAKGLAFAGGVPLFAVSTAALVASGAPLPPGRYLVVLDAMRGDVYATGVDISDDGAIVEGPTAVVPAEQAAREAVAAGRTLAGPSAARVAHPHARGVARLGSLLGEPVSVDRWEPRYGRLAEAQVKWEAAHRRPLVVG